MSICQILKATDQNLKSCAERIRQSGLVAFPTETVYGLGANALDATAVLKIFQTKSRPLTDPLIVHVASLEQALPLIDVRNAERQMLEALAGRFWPGPLTLILKASPLVPAEVTAGTGFIGVRVPAHPLALAFLKECSVPVAAPSANLFNHVSPTTAGHVFNDFFDKELAILDDGSATLGIESTVMKITESRFFIFRLGSLPKKEIGDFLATNQIFKGVEIEVVKKVAKESEAVESPGQFVKHYAPRFESLTLLPLEGKPALAVSPALLGKSALIDFRNIYSSLQGKVKFYQSMSEAGDLKEAMYRFYYLLREAENVSGIELILITDIEYFQKEVLSGHDYLESLYDKIFRSCSGRKGFHPL